MCVPYAVEGVEIDVACLALKLFFTGRCSRRLCSERST